MTRRVAALLGALAAGLSLVGCGGGEGADDSSADNAASAIGVRLTAPEGWFSSDDGLSIAERESDLTARVPSAPRVSATKAKASDADLAAVSGAASGDVTEVVAEPEAVTVGGRRGVAITLRESTSDVDNQIVRRYIAVVGPKRTGVLFVLEAPPDRFDDVLARMTQALGWEK